MACPSSAGHFAVASDLVKSYHLHNLSQIKEATSMGEYTLPHGLVGEQQRLALMSTLLDPLECATIDRLGIRPGR
jgi:hypothetical protein